jgi:RNA-binding protein
MSGGSWHPAGPSRRPPPGPRSKTASRSICRIDAALEAHELIKLKIAAERYQREQFVPLIEARLSCECVGTVGTIAILYREHPDPEKRKIAVPR